MLPTLAIALPLPRTLLTSEEKLRLLREAWGYVEVVVVRYKLSGERRYLAKNYSGQLLDGLRPRGTALPGNPHTTQKREVTGYTPDQALTRAYWMLRRELRQNGGTHTRRG